MTSRPEIHRSDPAQDHDEQLAQIITAATELMTRIGTDAVTPRAVAARAGVTIPILMRFFDGPETMLDVVLDHWIDRQNDAVDSALSALEANTLAEAVHQVWEFHRQFYRTHWELLSLYMERRATGRLPSASSHRTRLATNLHDALMKRNLLYPGTDRLVTEIAVELSDHIVERAFAINPEGDPEVLKEGEAAVVKYLESYSPAP